MRRDLTSITVAEDGTETHESWIRLVASKPSSTPGARLFDSEIPHQHYISVRVERCERKRDLHRDWMHNTKVLMEFAMSHAQWGAFVSSFGDGGGVPATLTFLTGVGIVPQAAPTESRIAASAREVKDAAGIALADIQKAYEDLAVAFNGGAGKRDMRERVNRLGTVIGHAPGNMKFAADSLSEHVENVVTKARRDIEAMAEDRSIALGRGDGMGVLGSGAEDVDQ
jgi:hypothetical protein